MAGAPEGNTNGTKLKDPATRQQAYKQYCDHIASGYPKQAFFFKHPTDSVSWATLERYIEENPIEFDSSKMEEAQSERFKLWLDKGNCLVNGKYKGGSPVVWQVIMRNIFKKDGWDQDMLNNNNNQTDARKAINHFENQ